tara:strand:+ start:773 stop:955 length:183 start_codon:yes stop_codon:yes gene_type:complete
MKSANSHLSNCNVSPAAPGIAFMTVRRFFSKGRTIEIDTPVGNYDNYDGGVPRYTSSLCD